MKVTQAQATNAIAAAVRQATTATDQLLISEAKAALRRGSYATAFGLAERVATQA